MSGDWDNGVLSPRRQLSSPSRRYRETLGLADFAAADRAVTRFLRNEAGQARTETPLEAKQSPMKHLFTKTNIAFLILAFILGAIAFSITLHRNRSHFPNSFVMKYADFGSSGSSDELFGSERFQGNGQRADELSSREDIKVVVYRNVDLATVKRTYPELGGNSVYHYLEYSQAMDYLDRQIEGLKLNNNQEGQINAINKKLLGEYEQSRARIIERLGP